MNFKDMLKRVNELTSKYPLTLKEIEELKILCNDLSVDCSVILKKESPF